MSLKRGLLVALILSFALPVSAEEVAQSRKRKVAPARQTQAAAAPRDVAAEAPMHHWIASGGIGLMISPTLFLIQPQLEYVLKPHFMLGPLVQIGIGSGVLFTGSASGRFIFGHSPKVKPCVEGALGLAFAGSGTAGGTSSVGIHIGVGIGVDFKVDQGIELGTMIRANFAPPLKDFFLSWPIVVGRFAI